MRVLHSEPEECEVSLTHGTTEDCVDDEVETKMSRAEEMEQSQHHGGQGRVRGQVREGELQDQRVPEAEGEAEHGEHPDLHRRKQSPLLTLSF